MRRGNNFDTREATKAPSLGDVASAAGLVVALISAWLYVAGWSYAYDYFDRFRIPLLLAELPREHLFIYGGLTLWKNLIWTMGLAGGVLAVTAASVSFRRSLGRGGLVLIAVLSILAIFCVARVLGVATAANDADAQRASDYRAYPRVTVEFTNEPEDGPLTDLLTGGCARLVLATSDRVFLIAPHRNSPALELNTTALQAEDIRALTISGLYNSCE